MISTEKTEKKHLIDSPQRSLKMVINKRTKRATMNQQGQAYLEAVIGLLVILGIVITLGAILGGFMTSLAGHHLLYEMLVCQETFQAENCSRATKERLKAAILLGNLQDFSSTRGVDQSSADARIKYSFLPALLPRFVFYLDIHESIKVPLDGKKKSK